MTLFKIDTWNQFCSWTLSFVITHSRMFILSIFFENSLQDHVLPMMMTELAGNFILKKLAEFPVIVEIIDSTSPLIVPMQFITFHQHHRLISRWPLQTCILLCSRYSSISLNSVSIWIAKLWIGLVFVMSMTQFVIVHYERIQQIFKGKRDLIYVNCIDIS